MGTPQERRLGLLWYCRALEEERHSDASPQPGYCFRSTYAGPLAPVGTSHIRSWPGTSSKEYGRSLSPEFPSRKVLWF